MTPADSKLCPNCGNPVDADSRFCKHCAFDLFVPVTELEATIVTAKPQQEPKSKRILILTAIGVLAVLGLGVIGGFIYKRHRAQASVASVSPTPSGPVVSERTKQIEERILRGETLTETDLTGLTPYELRLLRNVHFARYGRRYDQSGELGGYFYTRPWYRPNDAYNDNLINATDKANINLILGTERATATPANNATVVENNQSVSTATSSKELTRDVVMSLVRNRKQPITVSFPRSQHETYGRQNYERLMNERIIDCQKTYPLKMGGQVVTDVYYYTECGPGPNGRQLSTNGRSLDVLIGYKVPSEVTGISKIDETSSYADVLVVFEKTNGYDFLTKYQFIFNPYGTLRINSQNESRRVVLRLYDDGWRVERF